MKCQRCGTVIGNGSQPTWTFPEIPNLLRRLRPGDIVPAVECPCCCALVPPDRKPGTRHSVVVVVRGGVAEVAACPEDMTVEIRDYDADGCEPDRLAGDGSLVTTVTGPTPDWIDDFIAGAAEELADEFGQEGAAALAAEAEAILREHEARDADSRQHRTEQSVGKQ